MDFLPFTRPSIDEETIAGVADVLRSGWITTGPQAKAFEAELSRYCSGRTVRVFSSATRSRTKICDCGSRPVAGSSRNSTRGRCISARAIITRCA